MAIRCNTTLPPLAVQIKLFYLQCFKLFFESCVCLNMKYTILVFCFSLLVFASSCNKCYECKQYCAYCELSTGVRVKVCATKDVNHAQIDSSINSYRNAGYTCALLNDDRNVCDNASKINDATNYYYKQDYYCNAK